MTQKTCSVAFVSGLCPGGSSNACCPSGDGAVITARTTTAAENEGAASLRFHWVFFWFFWFVLFLQWDDVLLCLKAKSTFECAC